MHIIYDIKTGRTTIDTNYTPEPATPIEVPAPEIRLPRILTARQIRLWLLEKGITDETIISTLAELFPGRLEALKIEWKYSTTFSIDDPRLKTVFEALFRDKGITLEDAFREAARL